MTEASELPVLVAAGPLEFTSASLRRALLESGIQTSKNARDLIGCVERIALDKSMEFVLVGPDDLMESDDVDAEMGRLSDSITSAEDWINAVCSKFGVLRCPLGVLSLVQDLHGFESIFIASEPIVHIEGDLLGHYFAFSMEGESTIHLEADDDYPFSSTAMMHGDQYWLFARPVTAH